ncbi:MAG: hypothetical protein CL913_00475 [Deltaproteobacteria bacterium]|nr:hypothetical protein [Deltaproteobacteria bacterium]
MFLKNPKPTTTKKRNKETKGNKKKNQQRRKKGQEKQDNTNREKGEKDKNKKKGKSPNLQIIENLIQFLQLELCGISDCENRYTETCRSENEDYQPL